MKGRNAELRTLARTIAATRPARIALVGSGGSGKSMLAAELGHRLRAQFGGRIDWFRTGAWGFYTLSEMLALRFRHRARRRPRAATPEIPVARSATADRARQPRRRSCHGTPVRGVRRLQCATFVITARRCLLSGVLIYPVIAPLVTSGRSAFPQVAALTRLLRWNPLALDIADSIVASRAASAKALGRFPAGGGCLHRCAHWSTRTTCRRSRC